MKEIPWLVLVNILEGRKVLASSSGFGKIRKRGMLIAISSFVFYTTCGLLTIKSREEVGRTRRNHKEHKI